MVDEGLKGRRGSHPQRKEDGTYGIVGGEEERESSGSEGGEVKDVEPKKRGVSLEFLLRYSKFIQNNLNYKKGTLVRQGSSRTLSRKGSQKNVRFSTVETELNKVTFTQLKTKDLVHGYDKEEDDEEPEEYSIRFLSRDVDEKVYQSMAEFVTNLPSDSEFIQLLKAQDIDEYLPQELQRQNHAEWFGDVDFFVSHTWNMQFDNLLQALLNPYCTGGDRLKHFQYYFWIDLFAVNQHYVHDEETNGEIKDIRNRELDQFESIIESTKMGVILFLHPFFEPELLTRGWCWLEIYYAYMHVKNVRLAMTSKETKVLKKVTEIYLKDEKSRTKEETEQINKVSDMFKSIDLSQSKTTFPEDKDWIVDKIHNPHETNDEVRVAVGQHILRTAEELFFPHLSNSVETDKLYQAMLSHFPAHKRAAQVNYLVRTYTKMGWAERALGLCTNAANDQMNYLGEISANRRLGLDHLEDLIESYDIQLEVLADEGTSSGSARRRRESEIQDKQTGLYTKIRVLYELCKNLTSLARLHGDNTVNPNAIDDSLAFHANAELISQFLYETFVLDRKKLGKKPAFAFFKSRMMSTGAIVSLHRDVLYGKARALVNYWIFFEDQNQLKKRKRHKKKDLKSAIKLLDNAVQLYTDHEQATIDGEPTAAGENSSSKVEKGRGNPEAAIGAAHTYRGIALGFLHKAKKIEEVRKAFEVGIDCQKSAHSRDPRVYMTKTDLARYLISIDADKEAWQELEEARTALLTSYFKHGTDPLRVFQTYLLQLDICKHSSKFHLIKGELMIGFFTMVELLEEKSPYLVDSRDIGEIIRQVTHKLITFFERERFPMLTLVLDFVSSYSIEYRRGEGDPRYLEHRFKVDAEKEEKEKKLNSKRQKKNKNNKKKKDKEKAQNKQAKQMPNEDSESEDDDEFTYRSFQNQLTRSSASGNSLDTVPDDRSIAFNKVVNGFFDDEDHDKKRRSSNSVGQVVLNLYMENLFRALPVGLADVIVADPPFNAGVASWDNFDEESYLRNISVWAKLMVRALDNDGIGFVFTNMKYASFWIDQLTHGRGNARAKSLGKEVSESNFNPRVFVETAVWFKPDAQWRKDYIVSRNQQRNADLFFSQEFIQGGENQLFINATEIMLFFRKSTKKDKPFFRKKIQQTLDPKCRNLWKNPRAERNSEEFFDVIGRKPDVLIKKLIEVCIADQLEAKSRRELLVLEPFCGTSPALRACKELDIAAIGCDINERVVSKVRANLLTKPRRLSLHSSSTAQTKLEQEEDLLDDAVDTSSKRKSGLIKRTKSFKFKLPFGR